MTGNSAQTKFAKKDRETVTGIIIRALEQVSTVQGGSSRGRGLHTTDCTKGMQTDITAIVSGGCSLW